MHDSCLMDHGVWLFEWRDGDDHCQTHGARLMTLETAAESQFIFDALQISKVDKAWIGYKTNVGLLTRDHGF